MGGGSSDPLNTGTALVKQKLAEFAKPEAPTQVRSTIFP
jgi:hypothetical protein